MTVKSAGILLYRNRAVLEVFLVHPGGPWWANKEDGAWSIPKGEINPNEEPLQAARREFMEEMGFSVSGDFRALTPLRQSSGKWVHAWLLEGDCDAANIRSNTCEVQWPPRSGKFLTIPEVDRAAWMSVPEAERKLLPGQRGVLVQLQSILNAEAEEKS